MAVLLALLVGVFRLSVNGDPSQLLASSSTRYQAYESIQKTFPGEQHQILIYTEAPAFDPKHLAAYESVLKPLSALPQVAIVGSLFSSSQLAKALHQVIQDPESANNSGLLDDVKGLLAKRDYLPSRFVSAEYDALLMSVSLDPNTTDTNAAINAIEAVLEEHYVPRTGVRWRMAGNPVIAQSLSRDAMHELFRVTCIAIALGIAVAWWVFRHWRPVAQVVLVPLVAVIGTLGLMGWFGIALNLLTQAVLVVVFLVVFSDSLHALRGKRTHQSLMLACALTSMTTAAAAVALLFARSNVIQDFGVALLTGIAAGFVVWALCLWSGFLEKSTQSNDQSNEVWPIKIASSRKRLFAVMLLAVAVLLIPTSQLKTGFSLYENLPRANQSAQALAMAEYQFEGYLPLQVKVERGDPDMTAADFLQRLGLFQARINDQQLGSIGADIHWYSVTDVLALTPGFSDRHRLRALPKTVRQSLWRNDAQAMLFAPHSVQTVLQTSPEFLSNLDEALQQVADEEGMVVSAVTGLPALVLEASSQILPDAIRSVLLTILVLMLVVFSVLKSWKSAVIAALPVLFGVFGFSAFLVLLNEPLRHAGVVMLTLVIGISVDNALHLIVAAKHEKGHSLEAVRRCMPVLWVSTVTIVAGFIALTFSHIPSVSTLGVATAGALAVSFMASALWLPNFLEA